MRSLRNGCRGIFDKLLGLSIANINKEFRHWHEYANRP